MRRCSWPFVFLLISWQAGCRSDVTYKRSVTQVEGDESQDKEPVDTDEDGAQTNDEPLEAEDMGEFLFNKQHYQTRTIISLKLNPEMLSSNAGYRLFNETTGATLLKNDSDDSTQNLFYSFYPWLDIPQEKFSYGRNEIKLEVLDEANPSYAQSAIFLKDFPIQGAFIGHFSSNKQRTNNSQGWVNLTLNPVVKKDGTKNITGIPNIINQ